VRGAMNLRGRVVAVVDLAELVGLKGQPLLSGRGQVVILDRDRRGLGLLVTQVFGVEPVAPDREPAAGELVRGVGSAGGGAVTLLDPETLAAHSAAQFGRG